MDSNYEEFKYFCVKDAQRKAYKKMIAIRPPPPVLQFPAPKVKLLLIVYVQDTSSSKMTLEIACYSGELNIVKTSDVALMVLPSAFVQTLDEIKKDNARIRKCLDRQEQLIEQQVRKTRKSMARLPTPS